MPKHPPQPSPAQPSRSRTATRRNDDRTIPPVLLLLVGGLARQELVLLPVDDVFTRVQVGRHGRVAFGLGHQLVAEDHA